MAPQRASQIDPKVAQRSFPDNFESATVSMNTPDLGPHNIHKDTGAVHNMGILYIKKDVLPPWQTGITMVGNTVGTRIRRARIARNMTIKALVRASGISEFTIINIEHDRQNPSLSTLEVLSNILNVSVTKLGTFDLLPENTISERIAKARLMFGMNKTQFAQFIGVDESTIRFWERGDQTPQKNCLENLNSKILNFGFKL